MLGGAGWISGHLIQDAPPGWYFRTTWFNLLLSVVAFQAVCSAAGLWPWKKRDAGWVGIYLGVILFLIGSLTSQKWGLAGNLTLAEGASGEQILLDETRVEILYASSKDPEGSRIQFDPSRLEPHDRIVLPDGILVSVLDYYPHATGGEEVSPYGNRANPAVYFHLQGAQGAMAQWLFASDPARRLLDLGTLRVIYLSAGTPEEYEALSGFSGKSEEAEKIGHAGWKPPDRLLVITGSPDGKLFYKQIEGGVAVPQVPAVLGQPVDTGWEDLKWMIAHHFPNAQIERDYKPARRGAAGFNPPAVHLWVGQGADWGDFWLGLGGIQSIFLNEYQLKAAYGFKRHPLEFTVRLEELVLTRDPETSQVTDVLSRVQMVDPASNELQIATIRLDHPLAFKGLTFFQSRFEDTPDGPGVSVLRVVREPGLPFILAGGLSFLAGLVLMFFNYSARMLILGILTLVLAPPQAWSLPETTRPQFNFSALRTLPVESEGRVVALDTFARERTRLMTGGTRFRGLEPLDLIFSWLVFPKGWESEAFVYVGYPPLERALGVSPGTHHVSLSQVLASTVFLSEIQLAQTRADGHHPYDRREQAAGDLYTRIASFDSIRSGSDLKLVPPPPKADPPLAEGEGKGGWSAISSETEGEIHDHFSGLLKSYESGDPSAFEEHARGLAEALNARGAGLDLKRNRLIREVQYNRLRPIHLAAYFYVAAWAGLILMGMGRDRWIWIAALVFFAAAFLLETWGLVERVFMSGRPPVGNLYESVVWVSLLSGFAALVLATAYRCRSILTAGAACAAAGLTLSELSPYLSDPGLLPVIPVLRHPVLLSTHVLLLLAGLASLTLSLALAYMYLFRSARGRATGEERGLVLGLYRTLALGSVCLAAGMLLGGFWAQYSWGGFWGWWGFKEMWGPAALLSYLALLFGQAAGWWREAGLAVGSLLAYPCVVMAWYGLFA